MTTTPKYRLHALLDTIHATAPMIIAEAQKIEEGSDVEASAQYIEELTHQLAESVGEFTGNAAFGYSEGFEDGREEGRAEAEDEFEDEDDE